tara:strand:- start:396 stop:1133 length:738 start_codon:yes stop_codon:yes gene_type:complete
MVLEAIMLCVDNSDFCRNSDFSPNRLEAQKESFNILACGKMQQNPENTIGLLSLAGKVPRVLATPTDDLGLLLNNIHTTSTHGSINVPTGLQVAYLALKHRSNKNQKMRIVLFIGSPITTDTDQLKQVAKKLKKNNVACDVIDFSGNENHEKLNFFIDAVNKNNNSTRLTIPQGSNISNAILNSPIMTGGVLISEFAATAQMRYMRDTADGEDPELEMALRISLEEERSRQETAMAEDDLRSVDE